ncbi:hypothetical protein MPTK1_8g08560 [Marchantia polymorpha subsp. ruderalis]|uniref:Uncharacterized protein n=1 Tax=Marchantia polymorpha TaxID=3197 RepID=A0A2R6WRS0_MARPO|nr:hypothetical protein MARPO_0063s0063 [Marchantia polymorpha]BBN19187.1 hypothetical protein Mp_8g08560 [Marchantia polymorpha subsp. ruderalis]|eukprot:PTQ36524.1 hypothetical protein MARPO_0063s0063 [Marchantia polymorpha]
MAQALLLPLQRAVAMASVVAPFSLSHQQRVASASRLAVASSSRAVRLSKFQLNAAPGSVLGVEPDLVEEAYDFNLTAGEDREDDFPFGKADGHHTWHKEDNDVGFIEGLQQQIEESGGPATNPAQNAISWLFLPGVFAALAFGAEMEYICAACVLFIFAFIGIEMAKPDKPSNFEPEISRQDRDDGAAPLESTFVNLRIVNVSCQPSKDYRRDKG